MHLQAVRATPLNPGLLRAEAEAKAFAATLCQQSLQAYEQACEPDGQPVEEALVNGSVPPCADCGDRLANPP